MRDATIERETRETKIKLTLTVFKGSAVEVRTGVGFFDHMLTLFAAHGGFGLTVECKGDVEVDYHHTVEDVGICLGKAFSQILTDKSGLARYGDITLPMDEALVLCAVDLSGRGRLGYRVDFDGRDTVGSFDTELVEEFFLAFCENSGITLHLHKIAGRNTHHIIEACFKAFGRAMKKAVSHDGGLGVPSTKGVL